MTLGAYFFTNAFAHGAVARTGLEPFDLEWTWAILLGTAMCALVIYLIIAKR
jgi:hypothetical protein